MPDLSIGSPFARVSDLELGLRPFEPPSPLYKYMERRWAELMVAEGSIRLAPIGANRDLARPGQTQDQADGLQRAHMLDEDLLLEHPSEFKGWAALGPGFIANEETGSIMAHNVWRVGGADRCLVLCTTPLLDAKLMVELDPLYDCAVEIDNPIGFFITLSRHLQAAGTTHEPFIGRCSYDGQATFQEKVSGSERMMPRALMKRADHARHREVRMVFPTPEVPKSPVDLRVADLARYVKIVSPS